MHTEQCGAYLDALMNVRVDLDGYVFTSFGRVGGDFNRLDFNGIGSNTCKRVSQSTDRVLHTN